MVQKGVTIGLSWPSAVGDNCMPEFRICSAVSLILLSCELQIFPIVFHVAAFFEITELLHNLQFQMV